MASAEDDDALRRLILKDEVTDFLYREAELLDERRYDEWLELLADDVRYAVPLRANVRFGEHEKRENTRPGSEICWFDEDRETLEKRVRQIETGVHWAEEPLSRISRFVSNVHLESVALPEVTVQCHFLFYRNRVADEVEWLVGRRKDTLRMTDGAWKLCRRYVLLDQNVLRAKNLTTFL